MEGTENNLPDEQNANAGIAGAENPGGESTEQQPSQDDLVREWFKAKGKEVENLDDLLKEPEKIIETKEIDPYEGLLDDDDKAYLNFKKETGRSRKDFEALQHDWDKTPSLELARERVRRESGNNSLTNEQIDEYLQEELGVSLDEIDARGEIKLSTYAKQIRDEKKAEQEKYRKPAENKQPEHNPQQSDELVQLENGATMRKADYEKLVADQQECVRQAKEALKQLKSAAYKLKISDNGEERELEYAYEYAPEDIDGMSSLVADVQGTLEKRYKSDNGFNHAAFAEDMQWSDPQFREKVIPGMLSKARAEAIEEVMKAVGNHKFEPQKPIQQQLKDGVRMMSLDELHNRI